MFTVDPKAAQYRLDQLKQGKAIVTNDETLDAIARLGDEAYYTIRSLHNPKRVGILDQYIAWIGGPTPPPMEKRQPATIGQICHPTDPQNHEPE